MKSSSHKKFILAVAFQLSVIAAIIIFKTAILSGGTDVLLRIEPVDPRDLLRGDYITFQYRISRLSRNIFTYSPVKDGDTVYVPLSRQGQFWEVSGGITRKPPGDSSGMYIRGTVADGGVEAQLLPANRPRARERERIHVLYGIEEFFIPEGTGRQADLRGRDRNPYARVAIDQHGRAVLKQVYIDGHPFNWVSP